LLSQSQLLSLLQLASQSLPAVLSSFLGSFRVCPARKKPLPTPTSFLPFLLLFFRFLLQHFLGIIDAG